MESQEDKRLREACAKLVTHFEKHDALQQGLTILKEPKSKIGIMMRQELRKKAEEKGFEYCNRDDWRSVMKDDIRLHFMAGADYVLNLLAGKK